MLDATSLPLVFPEEARPCPAVYLSAIKPLIQRMVTQPMGQKTSHFAILDRGCLLLCLSSYVRSHSTETRNGRSQGSSISTPHAPDRLDSSAGSSQQRPKPTFLRAITSVSYTHPTPHRARVQRVRRPDMLAAFVSARRAAFYGTIILCGPPPATKRMLVNGRWRCIQPNLSISFSGAQRTTT